MACACLSVRSCGCVRVSVCVRVNRRLFLCLRQMLSRLRASISHENMRKLEGTRDMLGAQKASRMIRQYEEVFTERNTWPHSVVC